MMNKSITRDVYPLALGDNWFAGADGTFFVANWTKRTVNLVINTSLDHIPEDIFCKVYIPSE